MLQSKANQIIDRFLEIRERVAAYAKSVGRDPDEIAIVVVSKGQPAELIELLHQAGQVDFGENYWQELQAKKKSLAHLNLNWHFIGRLQSNKLTDLSHEVAYIHSLTSFHHALKLASGRSSLQPPLKCFIQVNLSGSTRKAGVTLKEIVPLCRHCITLPTLQIYGLMTMLDANISEADRLKQFNALRLQRDQVQSELGIALPGLSMGMSDDYKEAITAGATWLRLGRIIFSSSEGEDAYAAETKK